MLRDITGYSLLRMIINIINLFTIRDYVNKNYSHLTYRPDQSWRKGERKNTHRTSCLPSTNSPPGPVVTASLVHGR